MNRQIVEISTCHSQFSTNSNFTRPISPSLLRRTQLIQLLVGINQKQLNRICQNFVPTKNEISQEIEFHSTFLVSFPRLRACLTTSFVENNEKSGFYGLLQFPLPRPKKKRNESHYIEINKLLGLPTFGEIIFLFVRFAAISLHARSLLRKSSSSKNRVPAIFSQSRFIELPVNNCCLCARQRRAI